MQKNDFHNNKIRNNLSNNQNIIKKRVVDINKLLNRVKIDERKETKRKIIFAGFGVLILTTMIMFLTFIK